MKNEYIVAIGPRLTGRHNLPYPKHPISGSKSNFKTEKNSRQQH